MFPRRRTNRLRWVNASIKYKKSELQPLLFTATKSPTVGIEQIVVPMDDGTAKKGKEMIIANKFITNMQDGHQ